MELKIEYVPITDIKPYERNAKLHPEEQIEQIRKSIEQFGMDDPIGIWHDEVVEGHGRLEACKRLGYTNVPVVRLDHLTDEQRKAYALAHNKLTMNSGFDVSLLAAELDDLAGEFDMSEYGFDLGELADEIGEEPQEVQEDDFDEEPSEEPTSKLGDIYQLGEHRLMCGDSTNAEHVAKLMDGAKADMVFTDSPYGINIVNDKGKVGADNIAKCGNYNPVIGDDTTETAKQAYDIYSQLCDKMILWGGNYFLDFLPPSDGWLIWDKGTTGNFADGEMAYCSFHTPVRIYHQLWNGMIREGEHEKRVHPTQKPIRILSEILQDFTNEGDNILDVFGGSGSTLIACEQLNRKCYMMELSPRYVDVIIDRWEKLTGGKAELLREGTTNA